LSTSVQFVLAGRPIGEAGTAAGDAQLSLDTAEATRRAHPLGLCAAGVQVCPSERAREGNPDAVATGGGAAGEGIRSEPDQRQQQEAEQHGDDRLLPPAPAQRLGQPPGLFEHDHVAGRLLLYCSAASAPSSAPVSPAGWKSSAAELMQ